MSGEEVLRLFGRFEPLHLPFSSSRRSMRVLGTVVEIATLSVLDTGQQLASSHTIASQLVGDDHSRHVLQTLQQPPEEALGGFGIASVLNEDVEHNAVLIDGTPEIMLHALDPDEHFVEVPLVARPRPAAAQAIGKVAPNFLHQRRTVS